MKEPLDNPNRKVSELPTVVPDSTPNERETVGIKPTAGSLSQRPTVLPSETAKGRPESSSATPSELLAGRYRLLKELGKGGMGAVYLAQDELLRYQVAIKMLLPGQHSASAAERMRVEAALTIRLTHPSIMRIFDLHFSDPERFIVMEYLRGRPLDAVLAERGTLSVRESLEILKQVAAGLDYAHNAGVVHRDIKPANIMLCWDQTGVGDTASENRPIAKILDFGIAKAQAEVRTGGTRAGTFGYMPPEQLLGKRYDRRADVFALGVLAYELLTGELPFERSGAISPHARPKRLERFSSEVNLVLAKSVAW